MSAINFNPEGVLINNETVINAPYNEDFELSHNLFSSVDLQIKVGDTVLTPQTDYILTNRYERAATEMGLYNIYQRVRILNNAYSGSTLSIRYRAVGDFVDADDSYITIDDGDDRYCKRGNNLSDVNADNAILNLLEAASAVEDNSVQDNTSIPCSIGGKVSLLQIFNNWLKSKFQSWLGITVTESGGSITGRSFNGTSNKVANAITFSDDGAGAASGSTFDGSAARKLSYNSILTTAQIDAMNSGIKTATVMVSISASLNNNGTAAYITYNNWTLDRQDTGNAFLCLVTSEFKMTYDKTYFPAKGVSSKWNHGSLNGVEFASSPDYTTLTPGIYIVKMTSSDVYREFYSLDYLLNKILSIS